MVDPVELPAELRERVEILRLLGRGSFGDVYEVRVAGRQEPLALKLLSPEVDVARVDRELAACVRVRHPHVLTVHEHGVEGRRGWLLMERAEGTLAALLRDPHRVSEAWEACRQVAAGLAALHAQGIVHRDLKPDNVLMVGGVAKVGDLGLAKGGGLETLTATGLVMGTPSFMAPEQMRGEKITPAVDVFAFGVMLYRVATGRMPYVSEDVRHLLPVLTRGGPIPAGVPLGGCPEVVRACLDPDPVRRPTTAELARGLGPAPTRERLPTDPRGATLVLTSPGVLRPSDPAVTPVKGLAARNVAMAGGRNLLGVAVVTGLVAGFLHSFRPRLEAPPAATVAATPVAASWPRALGAEFPRKVREDLARAQGAFLDQDDVVHALDELDELDGGVPEGWRQLLALDPATWSRVVEHSPALARWYDWIAAGGGPWELTEEQRQELASLDRRFEGEGQPAPFRPWLGLAPAEGPPEHFVIRNQHGEVMVEGEFRGWTATALARAAAAQRWLPVLEDEVRAYFDGEAGPFPGPALEPLGFRSIFQVERDDAATFLEEMHIYGDHAEWRAVLAPWLERLATEVVALMAAARQACLREPEEAAGLPYLVDQVLDQHPAARLSGYWSLEFDVLAGEQVEGALPSSLRAVIWDSHVRSQGDLDIGRPVAYERERARLWARPLSEDDLPGIRDRAWFPWFVRFATVHGALGGRSFEELRRLEKGFQEELDTLTPRGKADVVGALTFAAARTPPVPGRRELEGIRDRYRALSPAARDLMHPRFRDLEPRLEELIHAEP